MSLKMSKWITLHNTIFSSCNTCFLKRLLSRASIQRAIKQDKRTFSSDHAEKVHTIDPEEVQKFSRLSKLWWDEAGSLKALHTLNELRIPLIKNGLVKAESHNMISPLKGLQLLDVGCGGGILSEPLSRLGAQVTGIDASKEAVEAAIYHSKLDKTVYENTQFFAIPVEDMTGDKHKSFDGVVASEILEHVSNPELFVKSCCELVKPGGSLFFTTLNKTWLSKILAIAVAENLLKLVPQGSHDWNKFIITEDLVQILTKNGCDVKLIHGMTMNPLTLKWYWINDTSVNYAIHAVKGPKTDS